MILLTTDLCAGLYNDCSPYNALSVNLHISDRFRQDISVETACNMVDKSKV